MDLFTASLIVGLVLSGDQVLAQILDKTTSKSIPLQQRAAILARLINKLDISYNDWVTKSNNVQAKLQNAINSMTPGQLRDISKGKLNELQEAMRLTSKTRNEAIARYEHEQRLLQNELDNIRHEELRKTGVEKATEAVTSGAKKVLKTDKNRTVEDHITKGNVTHDIFKFINKIGGR